VVLQPEHFEDLVAAVALIRPGPIRGNVVQRFTACRNGWARADVLHPALRDTLAKTYGCIVFQEQVNDVVAAMTGCDDAAADRFRKSLNKRARLGKLDEARQEFVARATAFHPDLDEERANLIFDQIEGWFGYGFTEGHAASFALTGYRSAYLSVHDPASYFAGMMNHQPMGFFSSNTLAGEARRRGIRVHPVEINASDDKCFAEDDRTIRLGLRLVSQIRQADIDAIRAERARAEFRSLLDFCVRVPLHRDCLENLILCGAFDNLHAHRRGLLWKLDETLETALSLRASPFALPLTPGGACREDGEPLLSTPIAEEIDDFSVWDKFLWTWRITGVCAECHVFAYLRDKLSRHNVQTVYEAQQARNGTRVTVAGLNVRPHRPPTRSGRPVLFTLIEDETGLLQATCAGEAIESCTGVLVTSPAVVARGVVQRRGAGVTFVVERAKPLVLADFVRDADELGCAQPVAAPEMRVRVAQATQVLRG
jgi:error-prone DNA polymerase